MVTLAAARQGELASVTWWHLRNSLSAGSGCYKDASVIQHAEQPMGRLASIGMAIALCLAVTATGAVAQQLTSQAQQAAMDRLKAAAGGQELKCTGSPGHATCTSDYAWVCPAGWKACRLTGGAKTCCTQN
jgi:hypothetical protein